MAKYLDRLRVPFGMSTAGGRTRCDHKINIAFPSLTDDALVAHVLDDTPPVVSVGRLCMKYNYAFYWPRGEKPYFVRPSGQRITLEVSDFIPYISPDSLETPIPDAALPVVCGQDVPEPCDPESFGVLDLSSPDLRVVCKVDRELSLIHI